MVIQANWGSDRLPHLTVGVRDLSLLFDIVFNNLRGMAELHENQLCGGDNLLVELQDATSANRHALGAQVVLYSSIGALRRDVRASGGYLSDDSYVLHFGLPAGATLERLEIIWQDGARSVHPIQKGQQRVLVTRM